MRIVLTGGGTGGHLTPFEPIIEALRTMYLEQKASLPGSVDPEKLELYFVGVVDAKARAFFKSYDVQTIHVPAGKLRRYVSALTVVDLLFRLPVGILKAIVVMWRLMPDAVVSKGGYGSIPVTLTSALYRLPLLLHDSDAVPGLATRLSARFATIIAIGFPTLDTTGFPYQHKTVITGTPVRARFGSVTAEVAKQALGIAPEETVILAMGGSQGAEQLNEVLLQALPRLVLDATIIHLTGEANFAKVTGVAKELLASSSRQSAYQAYPYLTEKMADVMAAADIVVSRAGATTLAELTRLRKAMLLIPLATAANNHQVKNAQIYEAAGAARVLDATNLGRNLFERSLKELIDDPALRAQLTSRLAELDHPEAARKLAELTFAIAQDLAPVAQK